MRWTRLIAVPILSIGLLMAPMPSADALGPVPARAPETAEARFRAELARYAAMTDGTVGIAVERIGTGHVIAINANTLFPMASTYKVAVAGTILSQIDNGSLTLDTMLQADPDRYVASDGLASLAPHPGVSLSVYNLLELMLTRSDNSATDILIHRAGGPQAVNAWLRSIGVRDQRVDSNTEQLLYRAMGIAPAKGTYRHNVDAAMDADPELRERDYKDLPNIDFAADPRDTSTPAAMVDLLDRIARGKALSQDSTRILVDIMARCRTGNARLKALLPPGTGIAHKTGTLNGMGNDVGIITLPDGRGFVIAVFVMKDGKGHEVRDRIIAEAARAAYDYFLFSEIESERT